MELQKIDHIGIVVKDLEGAAPETHEPENPTDQRQEPTCLHGPVARRGEEDSSGESQQESVSLTP